MNTGKCSRLCLFFCARTPPGIVLKLALDWLYSDTTTHSSWMIASSSSLTTLTDIANGKHRQSLTSHLHRQPIATKQRRQKALYNRGKRSTLASSLSTSSSQNVFSADPGLLTVQDSSITSDVQLDNRYDADAVRHEGPSDSYSIPVAIDSEPLETSIVPALSWQSGTPAKQQLCHSLTMNACSVTAVSQQSILCLPP